MHENGCDSIEKIGIEITNCGAFSAKYIAKKNGNIIDRYTVFRGYGYAGDMNV